MYFKEYFVLFAFIYHLFIETNMLNSWDYTKNYLTFKYDVSAKTDFSSKKCKYGR